MKRKLNARTLTLISLICALVCAVIAGFAFMNLFNSDSKNNNTASASAGDLFWQYASYGQTYINASKDDMEIKFALFDRKIYLTTKSRTVQYECQDIRDKGFSVSGGGGGTTNAYFIVPGGLSPDSYRVTVTDGSNMNYLYFSVNSYTPNPYIYDHDDAVWDVEYVSDDGIEFDECPEGLTVTVPSGWTVSQSSGWTTVYPNEGVAVGDYTVTIKSNYSQLPVEGGTKTFTIKIRNVAYGISWSSSTRSHIWTTDSKTLSSISFNSNRINVTWPSGFTYNSTNKTVTISASKAVGTYNISATPKSGYVWTDDTTAAKIIKYYIEEASISAALSSSSIAYSANSQTVTVSSYIRSIDLPDSSWKYSNGTITVPAGAAVGSYQFEMHADSNHTFGGDSTDWATLTITTKNASGLTVSAISDQTYTGSSIKPSVTVKDGTGTVPSSNYTVTYPSDTTNVGTKNITITFKNNCTGTKSASYKIVAAS